MDVSYVVGFTLVVMLLPGQCMEGAICKTDSDCNAGECCYIKPEFEVVSKKRQASLSPTLPVPLPTLPIPTLPVPLGKCERYKTEHELCSNLDKTNGHCGCEPGLTCQFIPAEIATATSVSRKRFMWLPGPGTVECKRI